MAFLAVVAFYLTGNFNNRFYSVENIAFPFLKLLFDYYHFVVLFQQIVAQIHSPSCRYERFTIKTPLTTDAFNHKDGNYQLISGVVERFT